MLFIDASKGFETGKNQNKLRDIDIKHIVETYKAFKVIAPLSTDEGSVIEDKYAYRAPYNEIKENDFNLNIPRYVDTFEEEEEVDIKAVQEEIVKIEKELKEVQSEMNKYLEELNLL